MSTIHVQTELPLHELLRAVEQLSQIDLERLMMQIITLQAHRRFPTLSSEETELLLKINEGVPVQLQNRFNTLINKRQTEHLTANEQEELQQLIERIEAFDVERIKQLAKLARLRGVSLPVLMEQLEIKTPPYV